MSFPSDIEIAQSVKPRPIQEIAAKLGLPAEDLIPYGSDKAKVHYRAIEKAKHPKGKLILVSAITPTPAGEGKTTTTIALAQGLQKVGKPTAIALREPSMGPLFGVKGGAAGGGYSQVIPMEDINLHFTGDFAAIAAAHNLLAAALDNALQQRYLTDLDHRRISFPRVIDMNDRSLRDVVIGLGGRTMGVPRETHFDITAASEVMAILCLSRNYGELKARLNRILLGLTHEGHAVRAEALKVAGAMAVLLKDAIHPNLAPSLEGAPTFIHGGPFANIAHGSNSVIATNMALAYSDYVVTEAGFGSDLGAEKFFDITCRAGGFAPSVCVLVATTRALKMHGGLKNDAWKSPNPEAVEKGLPNLEKHIENIHKFRVPVVVSLNRFIGDTDEELQVVLKRCRELNIPAQITEGFEKGGAGAVDLANSVLEVIPESNGAFKPLYDYSLKPEEKIEIITREIYGANHVDYTPEAKNDLKTIEAIGCQDLGICMAKTPKSFTDNPDIYGRPKDFVITVRRIEIAAGAGFIVPITGEILRMPGLPKKPSYENIDIDDNGVVKGIF